MVSDQTRRNLRRTAELLGKADALLITAGAGMSVDSGLPDFRGGRGFWRAYPPLAKLQISFEEMAQPHWFAEKHEPAAEEHAAMLPVLKEVARMMAWTWLRVQAYYEQQNDK